MSARVLRQGELRCPVCGKPRYAIENCCAREICCDDAAETQTFWNYEPTPARKVRVVIGKCPVPTFWWAGLEGQEREAVEVNYHGEKFYLDNKNGSGWAKVTRGRGGPEWGHSELSVVTGVTGGMTAIAMRCEDCPPVGYPTDKTRCLPCDRRTGPAIADRNPSGGDVKQAPSRSDESGGAGRQSPNLPPQGTE